VEIDLKFEQIQILVPVVISGITRGLSQGRGGTSLAKGPTNCH